jgi:hypothetical protein
VKEMWNLFQLKINRLGFGMVWRIEVQKRGAAHWHCLVTARKDRWTIEEAKDAISGAWESVLSGHWVWHPGIVTIGGKRRYMIAWTPDSLPDEYEMDPDPANRMVLFRITRNMVRGAFGKDGRACVVEWISGNGCGWWRYLADHATKRKQEQEAVGFGRHWGVVGRGTFKARHVAEVAELTDKELGKLLRAVQRLSTPQVKAPCVFGRKKGYKCRRGRVGRSVWFSDSDTYSRLLRWAMDRPDEILSRPERKVITSDYE